MTNVSKTRKNRKDVVGNRELAEILTKTEAIGNEFLRLRAKAVVSILRLSGKRNGEISRLNLAEDFQLSTDRTLLLVTFTLEKKTKRTLKQYMLIHPASKNETYAEAHLEWEQWKKTEEGYTIMQVRRVKGFPVSDSLTRNVIDYLAFLLKQKPNPKWFLPRALNPFGSGIIIDGEHHISPRQTLNILRGVSDLAWPHLFRETVAADVARQEPSLLGAFKIQRTLDLEQFNTAMIYANRYMTDVMTREEEQPKPQGQPVTTSIMEITKNA